MVALCTPHHRLRLDVGLGIISRLRRRGGGELGGLGAFGALGALRKLGGVV